MLKIHLARLQQYVNRDLPDVQVGFRKGRGTRDQISNIHRIIEKARKFQKNYLCLIDYAKVFDCVDHNKLWKIHKEIGIPDHFTCLLRNLYACQEATVRTRHGTTDWCQIRKRVHQGCMLSPCLFNLYTGCLCVYVFICSVVPDSCDPIGQGRRTLLVPELLSRPRRASHN